MIKEATSTLFGEWAVLREWGRRGSPDTMRLARYERRDEAETAEQRTIKRRLQHGYRRGPLLAASLTLSA
jgi:predicted DNA-binding WGR domain protein